MKKFNTIGKEEEEAAIRAIKSGILSGYVATSINAGSAVAALEESWSLFFGSKHAVACNSATSGLLAACMAIEVGPGDEVIVPNLTMSATAAAPAVLGATIRFADVEHETFTIDPHDVGELINNNTRAVIATNLFGHPAKLSHLRQMCDAAGIYLIEDNAQAIMAKEDGKFTGTIGHMGVFSLNLHKHIQAGEGGVVTTDFRTLQHRLNGAINHGECRSSILPGLNLRMTEITAAIAFQQLIKLPDIVARRQEIGARLDSIIGNKTTRVGCEHVYYVYPTITNNITNLHRILKRASFPLVRKYMFPPFMKAFEKYFTGEDFKKWRGTIDLVQLRLGLIETCSIDPTDEDLDKLELIMTGRRRNVA